MARKTGSHSDITGPKLREAALRLIARHGFAAVSVRQIAAEVGVQAGALYNYVPDKQGLLLDLLQRHMRDVLDGVAAVPEGATPVNTLEALTRFHIRFHLPRRDMVFVSYMELRNLTPENFALIEAMRRDYENRWESALQAGCATGDFALADTRVTTLGLIALLNGITNWYRADGRLSLEEIEEIYVDIVRKAVAA